MTQTVTYLQKTTFSVMKQTGISVLLTYKPLPLECVKGEPLPIESHQLHPGPRVQFKATWLMVGQVSLPALCCGHPAKARGTPPTQNRVPLWRLVMAPVF